MSTTKITLIARDIGLKFKYHYHKEMYVRNIPLMNDVITMTDGKKMYKFEVSWRSQQFYPWEQFKIWLKHHPYTEEELRNLCFQPNIPKDEEE